MEILGNEKEYISTIVLNYFIIIIWIENLLVWYMLLPVIYEMIIYHLTL